jgi:hypothetical protein
MESSRPASTKVSKNLSQKHKNTNKGAGGTAQVAEHLPSMCEILDSIPSTGGKRKGFFLHGVRKAVLF